MSWIVKLILLLFFIFPFFGAIVYMIYGNEAETILFLKSLIGLELDTPYYGVFFIFIGFFRELAIKLSEDAIGLIQWINPLSDQCIIIHVRLVWDLDNLIPSIDFTWGWLLSPFIDFVMSIWNVLT